MNMEQTIGYTLLERELKERKRKNPAYSLRSFSKYLGIPTSRLSEILAKKRPISKTQFQIISQKVSFSIHRQSSSSLIQEDQFDFIADWQHIAILSLFDLKTFSSNTKWMAKKLGISELEIKASIDRLTRLGLVKKENGKLYKTNQNFQTTDEIPNSALRKSHRQSLEQAIYSLENDPLEIRDIHSLTISMRTADLKLAKEFIRDFKLKFATSFDSIKGDEVYNLNIQFVPITKGEIQ